MVITKFISADKAIAVAGTFSTTNASIGMIEVIFNLRGGKHAHCRSTNGRVAIRS